MMARKAFRKYEANDDGWCDWVSPTLRQPYKLACCDCGLVHDMEFQAVEIVKEKRGGWWEGEPLKVAYRVLFRVRRNERETEKLRARDASEAA